MRGILHLYRPAAITRLSVIAGVTIAASARIAALGRTLSRHLGIMRITYKNNLFLLRRLILLLFLFRFLLLSGLTGRLLRFLLRRFRSRLWYPGLRLLLLCLFCFGTPKLSAHKINRLILDRALRRLHFISFSLQKINQIFTLFIQLFCQLMYFHLRHTYYLQLFRIY